MQPQGPQPPQYQYPAPTPQPGQPYVPPGYEFIHNATPPPKKSMLPKTPITRVLAVLGGLLILIILFSFVRGILSGGGNKAEMLSVVQDQQAILFITANAKNQQSLSQTNKYSVATIDLGIKSDQASTLTYLSTNKIKLNKKQFSLKVGANTTAQLTSASAASTYNSVYKSLMQQRLTTYQRDLQAAYLKTSGKKGRELLDNSFNHAKLLEQQLNTTATVQ